LPFIPCNWAIEFKTHNYRGGETQAKESTGKIKDVSATGRGWNPGKIAVVSGKRERLKL